MVLTSDPEVKELLDATRALTRQAQRLAGEITQTLTELHDFVDQVGELDERVINDPNYRGPERRDPR